MTGSTPERFREKSHLSRSLPGAITVLAGGLYLLWPRTSPLLFGLAATIALAICVGTHLFDESRLMTVITYTFDGEKEQAYATLVRELDSLNGLGARWHVEAVGPAARRNDSAGAASLQRRNPFQLGLGNPPRIKTNVSVISLPAGNQTLVFMPDRMLVFDEIRIGAVAYSDLRIKFDQVRFIESEDVPSDARVVGQTWEYVKEGGGPDARVRDNRKIPIALYQEMHLASATGLSEMFHFSKLGAAAELPRILAKLSIEPISG